MVERALIRKKNVILNITELALANSLEGDLGPAKEASTETFGII
jgi:hypothetical protein